MKAITLLPCVWAVMSAAGCGVFTGIPSHGGGKRFAVEQELISASARAAAKSVDITPLVGKKCSVRITTIGDEGGGNLVAGRYSLDAFVRGGYVSTPVTRTNNEFPYFNTVHSSSANSNEVVNVVPNLLPLIGGPIASAVNPFLTLNTANSDSSSTLAPLRFPSSSRTQTFGSDFGTGGGVQTSPTEYMNYAFPNPNDAHFLQAILIESLLLRGVQVVPPDAAEIDVSITVDVFGTHRKRVELYAYEEERLLAKTAFQISAVKRSGGVVLTPTTASYEAEYVEHYLAWCGPVKTTRELRKSEPLLSDFADLLAAVPAGTPAAPAAPAAPVPTPPTAPGAEGKK